MPVKPSQHTHHILLFAKVRDDVFTLREAGRNNVCHPRQSFLECIKMLIIISWHYLVRFWLVVATVVVLPNLLYEFPQR